MRLPALLALGLLAGCASLQPPAPDRELGPGLHQARDAVSADGAVAFLTGDAPGGCFRAELAPLTTGQAASPIVVPGPEACAHGTAAASETTLAVYAYNEGVVRLLERDGAGLRPSAEIRLPDQPAFPFPPPGRNLAFSPDGQTLLVGAVERGCIMTAVGERCGTAYLYAREPEGWRLKATIPRPVNAGLGALFGQSVLALADGSVLVGGTGTPGGAGAVHHYRIENGAAVLLDSLGPTDPTDWFYATELAASRDGGWVAIGGSQYVVLYRSEGGRLVRAQRLDAPYDDAGHFGAALALDGAGRTLLVGAPRASCRSGLRCGIVFRYARDDARWRATGTLTPATERAEADFGYLLALDASGHTSLIGGEMVHVFRR